MIYLAGTFNGWNATTDPLSDPEGDGIWTITMFWPASIQEYKFTTFDWGASEQFAGGESCPLTTGEFVNRVITVDGIVMPAVCWGSCDPCDGVGCPVDLDEDGVCDDVDPCVGCMTRWACAMEIARRMSIQMAFVTMWTHAWAHWMPVECAMARVRCTNAVARPFPPDVCDCEGNAPDAVGVCGGGCQSDTNGNGICDAEDVPGCTYPEAAANYQADATMDNETCVLEAATCAEGCQMTGLVGVSDILVVLSTFGQTCAN